MENYPTIDYRSYRRLQEGGILYPPSSSSVQGLNPVISPLEKDCSSAGPAGEKFSAGKNRSRILSFEMEIVLWGVLEIIILAGVVALLFRFS